MYYSLFIGATLANKIYNNLLFKSLQRWKNMYSYGRSNVTKMLYTLISFKNLGVKDIPLCCFHLLRSSFQLRHP